MTALPLCTFVCLCVLTVSAQNEVFRPVVEARPVSSDEMNVIIAECNRRININNTIAHSTRVPSDCSAYAFCEHPDTGVEPALMLCPAGLFFNDDMNVLSCVRPFQANCPAAGDPCSGRQDGYNQDDVRNQAFQGAFYRCQGGRTVGGGWCDYGEQFGGRDLACVAIQDRAVPPLPPRDPIPCHLRPVDSDPSSFILGDSVIQCAGGTTFDPVNCVCS